MDARTRIIQVTEIEFPGSQVFFDETSERFICFRIKDDSGRQISLVHPNLYRSEVDTLSDEELRSLIRRNCGF
jgi:hypothetical protein